MRRTIAIGSLIAALATPLLAAPDSADAASCRSRKVTGTVIGGVGGALLGGAVTHGSAGPIIGGLGGAVVGHEIGRSGCRRTVAYRSSGRRSSGSVERPAAAPAVYYDQYGQPVATSLTPTRVGYAPACHTETRSFYDERGRLAYRPVQVCDR
jgi:hypothetical protein